MGALVAGAEAGAALLAKFFERVSFSLVDNDDDDDDDDDGEKEVDAARDEAPTSVSSSSSSLDDAGDDVLDNLR